MVDRPDACGGEGARDRIRRILGDGPAPAAPRRARVLREVAGEPAPLSDALRERLALLDRLSRAAHPARAPGHARSSHDEPPPRASMRPPAQALPDSGWAADTLTDPAPRTLSARVGALARTTSRGTCWQVDSRFALSGTHGRVTLREGLARPMPLRPHEGGTTAQLDLRDAVFFDTETTGLAGGAGTVAFLVGLGWIEGDTLLVRQLFMEDYPEEAALLEAVREDIGDRALVSFNGRSYDGPLLDTRWRLSRMRSPLAATHRIHVDLLIPARRLWARTLHSRRLSSLERHVLGVDRGEDLAGAHIPSAWFHYLQTGVSRHIARAYEHNRMDIVSLLALAARVSEVIEAPERLTLHPTDPRGTARWLVELGRDKRARRCLEAGLEGAGSVEALEIRRDLGALCRRAGEHAAALPHWQVVAQASEGFDRDAYEHVAKIFEHHLGDPARALHWTEEALRRAPTSGRGHEALEHRAQRLRRKLARR